MKTASVNYLHTLINNRIYASHQIEFKKMNSIGTAIQNKLSAVSPFLLLLAPVFVMIAVTLFK
ncbi:hypothetical protein [Pedobacter sp. L105]|uniref:hypothetical protein n=1 Tax=Pedobacter sp. L105 TaxID=1641871 RepID=UPI00131A859C|nr:hypothetical protein [Pedobacter sp. L105]